MNQKKYKENEIIFIVKEFMRENMWDVVGDYKIIIPANRQFACIIRSLSIINGKLLEELAELTKHYKLEWLVRDSWDEIYNIEICIWKD